jgi:hypothetical protein
MIHDDPGKMDQREPTVFYVPLYQFIIRILLGSVAVIYFYFLPIPLLAFENNVIKTDIVARYGGDEFVFVMTNSDLDNAAMVMSRLEAQFIN